jgi:DNA-binding CsgD family transcriptional regulator
MGVDFGKLRGDDARVLSTCLRTLGETGSFDGFIMRACAAVRSVVPGVAVSFGVASVDRGYVHFGYDVPELDLRLDERLFCMQHRQERRHADFLRVARGEQEMGVAPEVVKASDFYDQRQLRAMAVYQAILRPRDLEHAIVIPTFRLTRSWIGSFGVERTEPDFDERDRALLTLVAHHLAAAAQNAAMWTRLAATLADSSAGAVVVVRDGVPVEPPMPEAFRLLSRYFGAAGPRSLPERLERWVRAQREAHGEPDALTPPPALRVPGAHGELVVRFVLGADEGGPDLVMLKERPRSAGKHALTARERDVLRWVAEGKTNREIGLILDVTENTVRSHMKQILDKLGVENRTAAAAIVLRGNDEEPDSPV